MKLTALTTAIAFSFVPFPVMAQIQIPTNIRAESGLLESMTQEQLNYFSSLNTLMGTEQELLTRDLAQSAISHGQMFCRAQTDSSYRAMVGAIRRDLSTESQFRFFNAVEDSALTYLCLPVQN